MPPAACALHLWQGAGTRAAPRVSDPLISPATLRERAYCERPEDPATVTRGAGQSASRNKRGFRATGLAVRTGTLSKTHAL
jgi:hypothetical protein